jgi:hypothetical protein
MHPREKKPVEVEAEPEVPSAPEEHHPKVKEGRELLCFKFNTKDGRCTAKGGTVTFT